MGVELTEPDKTFMTSHVMLPLKVPCQGTVSVLTVKREESQIVDMLLLHAPMFVVLFAW